MKAIEIYLSSNGELTKAFYAELAQCGPLGNLAIELFRAQKRSARAKVYRGKFKGMGYDVKQWSIDRACVLLLEHEFGFAWGWKKDPNVRFGASTSWVMYIDLPQGQVSFHSRHRGKGPDYLGEWDGLKKSAEHVIEFCDRILAAREVAA